MSTAAQSESRASPGPCWFPWGHLWSVARPNGRQECFWCRAVRYLRIVTQDQLR